MRNVGGLEILAHAREVVLFPLPNDQELLHLSLMLQSVPAFCLNYAVNVGLYHWEPFLPTRIKEM